MLTTLNEVAFSWFGEPEASIPEAAGAPENSSEPGLGLGGPRKIFLDFDGVLADMSWAFTQWAWERYGHAPSNIVQWGPSEALGVPTHEEAELWSYVWRKHVRLYDGAQEFLFDIPEAEIVSTRPTGDPRNNFEWHFRTRLLHRKVHLFESWEQKERFILREKPEALLEDNLKFLVMMPDSDTRLFLLDRPWNQSADISGHYRRVFSYAEFLEAI